MGARTATPDADADAVRWLRRVAGAGVEHEPGGGRAQSLLGACHFAGHRVSVRLYPEKVVIVADQNVVAEHVRAVDRDHVIYDWQHYIR